MKHKNWLFGLVSVLAVVFGLSFPGITATVEDQNAGDLADFYKITNPQLAPPFCCQTLSASFRANIPGWI